MNTKIASRGLFSKFQRVLLAVVATILLFGSFPVGKAHAWSYGTYSGKPGAASGATVNVRRVNLGYTSDLNLFSSAGPVAYRSPATTGAQTVMAVYAVQKWNGSSWVTKAQSGPFIGTISATQSYYRFPALNIQPNYINGYFRVTWAFSWGANGTTLGSRLVVSNLASDHVCRRTQCLSYPGYFQIW